MEQTQGVPAGASSAESPCQFAIDGGGNLYRRYSEPVCASCVPVMKLTDKWESARVADFNAGWNACRNAMLSAAPQAQPVAGGQAKGKECAGASQCVLMPDGICSAGACMRASGEGQSPAPAQAQPVEAEQAPAPVPELPPIDPGWTFNHARPKAGESGVWEIGFYDDEDDRFSPIVTVDTGLYYCKEGAEPLANAILARLAAQAPTVAPTQPSQPVREPMADEQIEDGRWNWLHGPAGQYPSAFIAGVRYAERHHDIGSNGGAE